MLVAAAITLAAGTVTIFPALAQDGQAQELEEVVVTGSNLYSLVVLNGRRTINYPVADGTGWYRTDINSTVPRTRCRAPSCCWTHEQGQWTLATNYSYQFPQGSSVALTVNNLFATDPPEQSGARFDRRRREFGFRFRHSFEN